jgi:formylglycine-generating enzyme required for sulfatase activity
MAGEPVELLEIPAGWFQMGWDAGLPDARPAHPVWVDGFRLARTPVTNAEFGTFLRASGAPPPPFWADPGLSDPEQPVVGVTWAEAGLFCEWLTRESGHPHHLPTEAEWERAARGGRESARYPWGDEPPARWFGNRPGPLPAPPHVGQGPANGFGLTDLAGVVHEWCRDWYAADAYGPEPVRAPAGPPDGARRVSRGGAWRHQEPWSPVAHRSSLPPHLRYSDYGFRVACGIPPGDLAAGHTDRGREPTGRPRPKTVQPEPFRSAPAAREVAT